MALNDEQEKVDKSLPEQFDLPVPTVTGFETHEHTGGDARKVKLTNIAGRRTILTSVASGTARTFKEELQFYTLGGTDRIYAYIEDSWNKIYDSAEYTLLTGGGTTTLHKHEPTSAPLAHASSHQGGGGDEINVAGLTGLLVTAQTPKTHATWHQSGGSDEIDATGLTGVGGGNAIFGDGSDGAVDINSTPTFTSGPITNNTLTRDAFFTNLTLSGGDLNLKGYRLFYSGILTINNGYKVHGNGTDGGAGAAGSGRTGGGTAGTAAAANSAGTLEGSVAGVAGTAGGAGAASGGSADDGGNNTQGNADAICVLADDGEQGRAGGDGGDGVGGGSLPGGNGGGATAAGGVTTEENDKPYSIHTGLVMRNFTLTGVESYAVSATGTGGSGGGGGGYDDANGEGGRGGGGGGSATPGRIAVICGKTLVNNGDIQCLGGNGGDGGTGADRGACGGGGGGGGAAGNGGVIFLVYNSKSGSGSISVAGGSGGSGGAGGSGASNNGTSGNGGDAGQAGKLIEISNT